MQWHREAHGQHTQSEAQCTGAEQARRALATSTFASLRVLWRLLCSTTSFIVQPCCAGAPCSHSVKALANKAVVASLNLGADSKSRMCGGCRAIVETD
jgi:hypothetical protein